MTINRIINVDEDYGSGEAEEPVTLQEVKDYLRLEGNDAEVSGIIAQEPLIITLPSGETAITVPENIVILSLTREGLTYTKADTVGNRNFTYDSENGIVSFLNAGVSGGEEIGIIYGTQSGNASADAFSFDDNLILSMITEARMWLEKYTGLIIVPRQLTVIFSNQAGGQRIPGPVIGSAVFTTCGDIVTPTLQGTRVKTCYYGEVTATYEAGMTTFPPWVTNAIKAYVADHYEFRGDDLPPNPNGRAAQIARPYIVAGRAWG